MNTSGEDHAADEVRYACMSRPWAPPVKAAAPAKPRDSWERFVRGDDDEDEAPDWKVI